MSRLRIGLCTCLLVAGGCTPEVLGSPTPSARVSPNSSAATIDLQCRLPVELRATDIPSGWITFPGGRVSTDPTGVVKPPPNSFFDVGPSYNWRFKRWVPVSWSAQSPDYSSYAYSATDGVHLVDVATGTDRVVGGTGTLFRTRSLIIVKFEPEGIYAEATGGGLWRINPLTGTVEEILDQGQWLAVGHGAAWGYTPATVGASSLVRVDLRDASTAVWYTRAPVLDVFGVDRAGRPVIAVASNGSATAEVPMQIMVLTGPEEGDIVHPSPGPWNRAFFENSWRAPSDQHGVWIPWPDGIYLLSYTPTPRLTKVADGPALPAGVCN